jgi:outer membrane protein
MKQLSLLLSIVGIGLGGTALFLSQKSTNSAKPVITTTSNTGTASSFKIAYFELDSLQNNYQYFKDALNVLKGKEESMNAELAALEKSYQKKIQEWQQKGSTMSQAESEAATREYQQMQQNFQARKEQLGQTMNDQVNDSRKKVRERLESYLKEYNKDKTYAYIFSDFPEAIYYKDTIYNITNDILKGLNEAYKKKK